MIFTTSPHLLPSSLRSLCGLDRPWVRYAGYSTLRASFLCCNSNSNSAGGARPSPPQASAIEGAFFEGGATTGGYLVGCVGCCRCCVQRADQLCRLLRGGQCAGFRSCDCVVCCGVESVRQLWFVRETRLCNSLVTGVYRRDFGLTDLVGVWAHRIVAFFIVNIVVYLVGGSHRVLKGRVLFFGWKFWRWLVSESSASDICNIDSVPGDTYSILETPHGCVSLVAGQEGYLGE